MNDVVIGIDLGGTNVKVAAVSREGEVLGKASRPTDADAGPGGVMDVMSAAARDLLRTAGVAKDRVSAAGIGAPGPMDWRSGVVFSPPNLPGWENVPLAGEMSNRLGIPCFVDNDANCACYGEFWLGAGREVDSMCLLTLGTGVGGGIVLFGRLLRGPDGTAAEIGHLKVRRDGRLCGCGAKGCLEAYASVTGMVRTAVKGIDAGMDTALKGMCGNDLNALTGKMISDAAEQGDEFARGVITETGIWLGVGCSSLINLLNPEKIVFAGGMIGAGDMLFTPIRDTARSNSFAVPAKRCIIEAAGLGPDAGVIGAAGCALERIQNAS